MTLPNLTAEVSPPHATASLPSPPPPLSVAQLSIASAHTFNTPQVLGFDSPRRHIIVRLFVHLYPIASPTMSRFCSGFIKKILASRSRKDALRLVCGHHDQTLNCAFRLLVENPSPAFSPVFQATWRAYRSDRILLPGHNIFPKSMLLLLLLLFGL